MSSPNSNNTIAAWLITYDNDADKSYLCFGPEKALACVMGSLICFAYPSDDAPRCPQMDKLLSKVQERSKELMGTGYVPIEFFSLRVDLRLVVIDRSDLAAILNAV
jgi:hypothetical protein